jgi:hypothetical protein
MSGHSAANLGDAACRIVVAHSYEQADAAVRFVDYGYRMIPKYEGAPDLLDDYVQLWS